MTENDDGVSKKLPPKLEGEARMVDLGGWCGGEKKSLSENQAHLDLIHHHKL